MAVTVIINPISGGAPASAARRRALAATAAIEANGQKGDIYLTQHKGHARELAQRAVSQGAQLVIAWGGDGTVNEVASSLAFSSTPLGIVPSGSGNGLATELGISSHPDTAIADAMRAQPRAIDVGEIGGSLFVNLAGIGFDAHVAACFDREAIRRGVWNYAKLTLRELATYRCGHYRINEGALCQAFLITVANSTQFGHGARIAPEALVDDAQLDMVVFEETSRLATFFAIPRLFTGSVARLRGASFRRIERATIEGDLPMTFHVDGEPRQGGTWLAVRVHPGALRIAVK